MLTDKKNDNNKLIIDIIWAAVFFHFGFKNYCFLVNTINSFIYKQCNYYNYTLFYFHSNIRPLFKSMID